MTNPLFVFALPSESGDEFNDYNLLHTGVGKINATFALTSRIASVKPSLVVNLGSAGSSVHAFGEIVNPVQFIQRDMDATALGFEMGEVPFSGEKPILDYGIRIANIPSAVCGTGDTFDTSFKRHLYDIADMEAYALAKVCKNYNIPFVCLKFISDGADDRAGQDWKLTVKLAAQELRARYNEYQNLIYDSL